MSHIFEYGGWLQASSKSELQQLLKNIWQDRLNTTSDTESTDTDTGKNFQPFLQFDGDNIRANNYVGFIQNGGELIEIYPKVFRAANCADKSLMLRHIFYWFSYCRKWKFPFNQANLENNYIDKFPELIIHLIANQIFEVISTQPLMQFQQVEESLSTPRGNINFSRYVQNSLAKGNFHKIECDYDPFLFDNNVNRIIKYCARILIDQTRYSENINLLQECINILDDVEDASCTNADIEEVSLNSFYQEYVLLMESCKLVINQQLYSNKDYDLSQWCLLFPMEYIFEDFIAGFMEKHLSDKWIVKYQKSDQYLSDKPEVFNMQHDIYLTSRQVPNRHIIIDTKYKVRDGNFKQDKKKGIQQTDLYQMLSYAYKRGCNEVILIYPNISEDINEPDKFVINSGFNREDKIYVTAIEVPFWSVDNFGHLEEKLKTYLLKYF